MNARTRPAVAIVLCLCFAALPQEIRAGGERTNIRGIGMARTFVAASRGLDAVGINPANLGYPDSGTVTFSFIPVSLHAGTDMMNYGIYRDYFTGVATDSGRVGRYLAESDKQRILDEFPGGIGRLAGDVEVRLLGLTVDLGSLGRCALTVTEQAGTFADIPRSYAEFILYGNPPGSVYDFSASKARAEWLREYGLSYGRQIPALPFFTSMTAGIGIKYVQGFAYYELDHFTTRLTTGADGVLSGSVDMMARSSSVDMLHDSDNGDYMPFPEPAGQGWGFDLGVAGEIMDGIRVGIAVTDIGWIEWTRHAEIAKAESSFVVDNPMDETQRRGVEDAMKGQTRSGEPFTRSLATKVRIGGAAELHKIPFFKNWLFGELSVAADYNQGFSDGPLSSTRGRLSLGMEYRPWRFLPVRTGVSIGGEDRFNFALGIGFHFGFLDVDFGSENVGWIFNSDSFSYASLAAGLTFRF